MVQKKTESHTDECASEFQHYAVVIHSDFLEECAAWAGQLNWFGWVLKEQCVFSRKLKVVWPITAIESWNRKLDCPKPMGVKD